MPLCTTPTLLRGVLHTNVPGEPPSGQDLLHELTAGRPSLAGTRDHSGITDSRRWTGSPQYVADSSSLRRIRGGPGRYDPDHPGPSPVGLRTARQGVRFPPGAPFVTSQEIVDTCLTTSWTTLGCPRGWSRRSASRVRALRGITRTSSSSSEPVP